MSEHSVVPDEDTDPFILAYEFDENSDPKTEQKFRFCVTSKLLLKSSIGVVKVHCDATHKLCWNNIPVLIIGTADLHRKFHPFGVAVSTNETTLDYEFLFKSLKEGLTKIFEEQLNPTYLISDAAKSIQNAFRNIFGEDKIVVMCWFHVRQAV